MIIHSRFKDYDVCIEKDLDFLKSLTTKDNTQYVIDKNVYELYSEHLKNILPERLTLIEATEEHKVIDTALDICEKMTEIPAKRNATLISIGGGIIQDITGFVANVLYRGINWIFVPTTLLASCDSCIGGKTSLNYKKYKNLLGTFYPPDEIHICAKFFETLTERDYKSGLGEVVKFNIMAGMEGLEGITANIDSLLKRESDTVNVYVEKSLNFKKQFIEIDEFDKGERIKLNFAHTFGHAIEVVTKYEIPHGTAVAIGMIMADSLSLKRNLLSEDVVKRSEEILLKVIDIDINLLNVSMMDVISAMRKDKKQTGTSLTAVLMTENGFEIVRDIKEEEVSYSFNYFKDLYMVYKN